MVILARRLVETLRTCSSMHDVLYYHAICSSSSRMLINDAYFLHHDTLKHNKLVSLLKSLACLL